MIRSASKVVMDVVYAMQAGLEPHILEYYLNEKIAKFVEAFYFRRPKRLR